MYTLLKLAQLWLTGHVTRMPMSGYQRKYSMENFRWKSAPEGGQKKTLQRHTEILSKIFQHTGTSRVLGTYCTGSSKVALPNQKWSRWLWRKENLRSRKKAQRVQSQTHEIIIRVVILKIDLLYLQHNILSKTRPNQPSKNPPAHKNTLKAKVKTPKVKMVLLTPERRTIITTTLNVIIIDAGRRTTNNID